MRIAIPTYKRALLIQSLTIGYLRRCAVPMDMVWLFVSGDKEATAYESLGIGCHIVTTYAENARDKFNFIHSYFPEGEEVLVLEDDIESVQIVTGYNQLEEMKYILESASYAFHRCKEERTALWGISSNSNPFFMKQDHCSVGFKFIVANLYGFIQTEEPILITQPAKTDYERTMLYYRKFGKLVRLDYLCPITKNYKNPGGMQDQKHVRHQMEQTSVDYLVSTFPDLCSRNETKTSLYPEIKLKTIR